MSGASMRAEALFEQN